MSLGGEGRKSPADAIGFLRAAAHPTRLRIMSLLTGVNLSAAEVAAELGLTHANASYHLRLLERAGEIVVVETEKVRGGVAKRYGYRAGSAAQSRSDPLPDPPHVETTGSEAMIPLVNALAVELRRRLAAAGTDVEPAHFSDVEVWLPAAEYRTFAIEINRLSRRIHQAALPPRTPGCVPVSFSAVMFGEGGATPGVSAPVPGHQDQGAADPQRGTEDPA